MTPRLGRQFLWTGLGAALLGIVVARWAWLLFAPAGAVMPPAVWEATDDSSRLFGKAHESAAAATLTSSNIKLIGVFANPVKGFAVMQVDGRQIGVALGGEVRPGVRLAETHHDHVILDQGGARVRIDLAGVAAGTNGSSGTNAATGQPAPDGASPSGALQSQSPAAGDGSPPQSDEAPQRQPDDTVKREH